MTVKELIAALQPYNPDATVESWCSYENGDVASDVGCVTITGVAEWSGEDKATVEMVHLNCTI